MTYAERKAKYLAEGRCYRCGGKADNGTGIRCKRCVALGKERGRKGRKPRAGEGYTCTVCGERGHNARRHQRAVVPPSEAGVG